jgi:squalene-hopene/tetraprenyl-beta-curcumene cyclase
MPKNALPMKTMIRRMSVCVTCLVAGSLFGCSHSAKAVGSWDPKAAAAYLDQREDWWMKWPAAARDQQTFCVSCHTAVPYAISRPALRKLLAEQAPVVDERLLLDNVTKRVRLWKDIGPFYNDKDHGLYKTEESRGTEAVLNALILASRDAQIAQLSDDTRAAFNNMWALQLSTGNQKGAWWWIQFNLRPWEATGSQYYGAVLAAVAVGTAPGDYRSSHEIQNNLKLLQEYLTREDANQSLIDRVGLLWASTKWPGLLDQEQQKDIIKAVLSEQQGDGGWSLSSLSRNWRNGGLRSYVRSWIRQDGTLVEGKSDGYATGLVVFVLQQAGVPRDSAALKQGLAWLVSNQDKKEGLWAGYSLNQKRNASSNIGHFMSDAATAYAVLALTARTDQQ